MGLRPRTKLVQARKARRCRRCGAKLGRHDVRCARCSYQVGRLHKKKLP